jgi:hypothetical protein
VMTPDEAVQAMADRLRAIDYERHGHRVWSKAALLREYLRRAARWAAACESDTRTPFFDIAHCVDPAVRAEPAVVDGLIRDFGGTVPAGRQCRVSRRKIWTRSTGPAHSSSSASC